MLQLWNDAFTEMSGFLEEAYSQLPSQRSGSVALFRDLKSLKIARRLTESRRRRENRGRLREGGPEHGGAPVRAGDRET
jgi:hypothetical protein